MFKKYSFRMFWDCKVFFIKKEMKGIWKFNFFVLVFKSVKRIKIIFMFINKMLLKFMFMLRLCFKFVVIVFKSM